MWTLNPAAVVGIVPPPPRAEGELQDGEIVHGMQARVVEDEAHLRELVLRHPRVNWVAEMATRCGQVCTVSQVIQAHRMAELT